MHIFGDDVARVIRRAMKHDVKDIYVEMGDNQYQMLKDNDSYKSIFKTPKKPRLPREP